MTFPRAHPFEDLNGGAPQITRNPSPPEYRADAPAPHQVAVAGAGGEVGTPPGQLNFSNVDAAAASLHPPGSEHMPHLPKLGSEGEAPPGAEGAAGAGEAAATDLGGEAAGEGLLASGMIAGLL